MLLLWLFAYLIFFREMLAEGALTGAFTKVFTEEVAEDSDQAYMLFWTCWKFFSILSILFCGLGMYFAEDLVYLMSLSTERSDYQLYFKNAVALTEVLFPYLGVVILASIVMGVLHERGRYFVTSISPILFNLGFITGAVFLGSFVDWLRPLLTYGDVIDSKLLGLAVGVLGGGVIQLIFQFYFIYRDRKNLFSLLSRSSMVSQKLKDVLKIMLPASVAASTGPVNIFINTNFATGLGEGVVTWLNYSFRLLQLPVGVFGVAIGVAVLPPLTREIKNGSGVITSSVSDTFVSSLEAVLWVMASCSLFLFIESKNIISLLFGYGKFSANDIIATSSALKCYSFAAMGYGLIKVMTSFYYALGRTNFAMYVSIFSIFVNFTSNYYLSEKIGYIGLALTSSLTLSLNALILFVIALRLGVSINFVKITKSLSILFFALVACGSLNSVSKFLNLSMFSAKLRCLIELSISGAIFIFVIGGISVLLFPSFRNVIKAKIF